MSNKIPCFFLSGKKEVLRCMYKKAFVGALLFLLSFDAFGHYVYDFPYERVVVGGLRSTAGYLNAPAYGVTIGGTFIYAPESCNVFDRVWLMMQGGIQLDYMASHAEKCLDLQEVECADRFFSVSMPLNLGICFGDVGCSIDPYMGIDARLNMIAKSHADGYGRIDYFDDLNAKRFQLGLNAGVDVNLFFLYLGYRFTKDLTDFIPGEHSRNSCHRIFVGFNLLFW